MDKRFLAAWALFVGLMVGLVWASVGDAADVGDLQAIHADLNSGTTVNGAVEEISGVTPILVIDLTRENPAGTTYSFQLDTLTFGGIAAGGAAGSRNENLDPNGTGLTADSGASITVVYGISNHDLTLAEWLVKGETGTTEIATFTVGGVSDNPVEFTPEISGWLMIGVKAGASQFQTPKGWVAIR